MIVFYFQCQNYVNYNHGNNEMITVIMNTPNLSMRYSMTMSRETRFADLFKAYFGLTVSVLRAKNKLSIQFVYSCRSHLRHFPTCHMRSITYFQYVINL